VSFFLSTTQPGRLSFLFLYQVARSPPPARPFFLSRRPPGFEVGTLGLGIFFLFLLVKDGSLRSHLLRFLAAFGMAADLPFVFRPFSSLLLLDGQGLLLEHFVSAPGPRKVGLGEICVFLLIRPAMRRVLSDSRCFFPFVPEFFSVDLGAHSTDVRGGVGPGHRPSGRGDLPLLSPGSGCGTCVGFGGLRSDVFFRFWELPFCFFHMEVSQLARFFPEVGHSPAGYLPFANLVFLPNNRIGRALKEHALRGVEPRRASS